MYLKRLSFSESFPICFVGDIKADFSPTIVEILFSLGHCLNSEKPPAEVRGNMAKGLYGIGMYIGKLPKMFAQDG